MEFEQLSQQLRKILLTIAGQREQQIQCLLPSYRHFALIEVFGLLVFYLLILKFEEEFEQHIYHVVLA